MKTDICIIGGGLVGCMMAAKLSNIGFRVTILEVGSADYPNKKRDIYTNSGEIHYPLNQMRVKAVGGSTHKWGAHTPRLLECDFNLRSIQGVGDDWPINYTDLETYYSIAEAELGVSGNQDNKYASYRNKDYPLPAKKIPKDLKNKFKKIGLDICSQPRAVTTKEWDGKPPNRHYRAHEVHLQKAFAASQKFKIITDAIVTRLEIDQSGKIKRAIYMGLTDRVEKAQEASLFVVAAGAIETPRLLLLSTSSQFPNGLANKSGLVGKYFMEHTQVGVACFFDSPFSLPFRRVMSWQYYERKKEEDRSALMLTIDGFPKPEDFIKKNYWGEELQRQILSEGNLQINISCTVEEIPYLDSYIALDPSVKDISGNPAPRINYSLHPQTKKTMDYARDLVDNIVLKLEPKKVRNRGDMRSSHHMGTCRMSNDPSKGVVNENLVAHDIPNLMIVGSAVNVSSGCPNPSLTIAALALRAVDYIKLSSKSSL
jgi:choline dehydrogenase-like flavoprotein